MLAAQFKTVSVQLANVSEQRADLESKLRVLMEDAQSAQKRAKERQEAPHSQHAEHKAQLA